MIGLRDAYDAARFAYENRKELAAFWRWFKKSRLLIIGPGGVGKTTLARVLAGEIDWLTSTPWEYSQSYNVEKLKLNKHLQVEMVVAPGQKFRRNGSWRRVHSELAAGKYRGVILVSAFGHHSIPEADLKTVQPGLLKDQALETFLARGREEEIAVLRELTAYLRVSPKKLWLVSVVAKQDLWHSSNDSAVRSQYEAGEYAELLRAVASHRGADAFRHETVFVSLVIANYQTARGEVLKRNVAGYDHRMQVESVRRLIAVLDSMRAWE